MPAPVIADETFALEAVLGGPPLRLAGCLWLAATTPIEQIDDIDTLKTFAETLEDLLDRVVARRADLIWELRFGELPSRPLAPPVGVPVPRCDSLRLKAAHAFSRSNPVRTRQSSTWRCFLPAGHRGPHQAHPSAHQAPWGP